MTLIPVQLILSLKMTFDDVFNATFPPVSSLPPSPSLFFCNLNEPPDVCLMLEESKICII